MLIQLNKLTARGRITCVALLAALASVNGTFAAPPILISGFDDVLRQAENQNLLRAGLKLFEPDETFSGMPELYAELTTAYGSAGFSLVSGTSSAFRGRIEEFLLQARFPKATLSLRNWFTQWSVEHFKINSIRKILGGDSARKFTVIFDNSPPSLEMAKAFSTEFPGQALAIYLHEIVQRPAVEGARQYLTAFDIAVAEFRDGRLPKTGVEAVARAILAETRAERLIPKYAYCPVDYDPCSPKLHATIQSVCNRVRDKVRDACRTRSAGRI